VGRGEAVAPALANGQLRHFSITFGLSCSDQRWPIRFFTLSQSRDGPDR
jgi:hypothetical protein